MFLWTTIIYQGLTDLTVWQGLTDLTVWQGLTDSITQKIASFAIWKIFRKNRKKTIVVLHFMVWSNAYLLKRQKETRKLESGPWTLFVLIRIWSLDSVCFDWETRLNYGNVLRVVSYFKIKQSLNLKNLSRNLNLIRGLNMVGST